MNKERKARFNDVVLILEEAKDEIQDIQDEEQEAFDSLSDGLQCSSRGNKMQEYIDLMDDCMGQIDGVIGYIQDDIMKKK